MIKKLQLPLLVIVYTALSYFCMEILYAFKVEAIVKYQNIIGIALMILAFICFVVGVVAYAYNKMVLLKTFWSLTIYLAVIIVPLFILAKVGVLQKFESVESLREMISKTGNWTYVLFFAIQFFQVTILPLPSSITIGAGVLLFGPLVCAIISYFAIIFGSISAFLIGRYLGFKVSAWIVGKEELETWLKKVEKKSILLISVMYLFPFFPDDTLCIIAGITAMPFSYFLIMTIIVRALTVFINSYSFNNSLIPYTTWWGILIWIVIFILIFIAIYLITKKGDKIIDWWEKKHPSKKKDTK